MAQVMPGMEKPKIILGQAQPEYGGVSAAQMFF